ncbi:MAG: hypothetical protein QXP58_01270 [Thermoprotei archaeon]
MSEEEFWRFYRKIESVAHSSLEEFVHSDELLNQAIEGIRGCLLVVEGEARWLAEKMGLNADGSIVELSWTLAKAHVISPKILDDLEDVYRISQKKVDRLTVYSALIKSMEVVEALWSSIKAQLDKLASH